MNCLLPGLLALVCALAAAGCARKQYQDAPPQKPEETLAMFNLDEALRIELFAAEPDVVDPVEIAFDASGRCWVAEMIDYPEDPPAGKPPRGRIRLLEDRDGDGRADRSTLFAERLLQVTSVLPYKNGVLACSAPDILYLEDTDGDGKADVRKALFTGFAMVNPEGRITNLRYGIDNWIYASNNGQAGNIRYLDRPDAPPVQVLGADFRFRLDRGLFEAESGTTQFGAAMNDWGDRFITQNTVHARHVVLPRRYLVRNPYVAPGEAARDISDHGQPSAPTYALTRPQQWREARTRMRQQRYRENKLESVRPLNPSTEIVSGYFTGGAGGTIYSADLLPEQYRGNLFTGDVSGNFVHRDILRRDGVSYSASRGPDEEKREFLASTDPWFRPCNFATGPDGALYVVDMYREFIETPESIPEELKKGMDFWSGDTMGRIYRIVPKAAPPSRAPKIELARAATADLVPLLGHANAWWRITAQRLLVERQDRGAVAPLRAMADRRETPQARLHALYALEGLGALDAGLVGTALADAEPGVREHAVRLAESYPELGPKLVAMISDPSPRVRLQLALSLGEAVSQPGVPGREALAAIARLAASDGDDRWFRSAIVSVPPSAALGLLGATLEAGFFTAPGKGREPFLLDLASVVGARCNPEEIAQLLRRMSVDPRLRGEPWRIAGLNGLARGLRLAGAARLKVPEAETLLGRDLASPSDQVQLAARAVARHVELPGFMATARREALDRKLAARRRQLAIYSLGSGAFAEARPTLEQIITSETDPDTVKAAMEALGSFDDPAVGALILDRWKSYGPAARTAALDLLLERRSRVPDLLAALESGRIERAALDLPRKEKLLRNPDAAVAERARKLFGDRPSDRAKVVADFRAALGDPGDPARGKVVFEKTCAKCHLPQRGRRIGSDLSGVSSRTREQLLEDILDPSRAVDPRFTNYIVVARDGRILDGLIAGETPGTLTVRRSEGDDEVLLRSNVAEIRASSTSLMPDGLEVGMSRSDLADLIAFLQGANLRSAR